MADPLHPIGKCRCCGEGRCDWCVRSAREEFGMEDEKTDRPESLPMTQYTRDIYAAQLLERVARDLRAGRCHAKSHSESTSFEPSEMDEGRYVPTGARRIEADLVYSSASESDAPLSRARADMSLKTALRIAERWIVAKEGEAPFIMLPWNDVGRLDIDECRALLIVAESLERQQAECPRTLAPEVIRYGVLTRLAYLGVKP